MTAIKSQQHRPHGLTTDVTKPAVVPGTRNTLEPIASDVGMVDAPAARATVSGSTQAMARQVALGREDIDKLAKLGGRIDRNGDGVASDVEKRLAVGRGLARGLIRNLDQDGDGRLTGAELPEALRAADRNGDGAVTKQELRKAFNGSISREERFQGFDANGDGTLSGREIADPRFARDRDHDGDGQVSREEFLRGRAQPAVPPPAPAAPPVVAVPPVVAQPSTPSTDTGAPVGPGNVRERSRTASTDDVFSMARLDRNAPAKVSWYHPHRQNETPTLRLSGNVTSENFFREVALASMNVGMSPRRMASVLQDSLPKALEGLGVKLDANGRADLARVIREGTTGLPRAHPIPHHLHPDTTGHYLDDNPAAAGWRQSDWARSLIAHLPRM